MIILTDDRGQPLTTCPGCGRNLKSTDALEVMLPGQPMLIRTAVDAVGQIPDKDNAITNSLAAGYDLCCSHCQRSLQEFRRYT